MSARAFCGLLLACAAAAAPHLTLAQTNLGFEQTSGAGLPGPWSGLGREVPDGPRVRVDSSVAAEGARSLEIVQTGADELTRIGQRVPGHVLSPHGAEAGGAASRIRVRAAVRSAGAAQRPAIWLRMSGARGSIYLDSRSDVSESAAGGWLRAEVELALPADVEEIRFGAVARGAGSAWFDDFELDVLRADDLPPASAGARAYLDAALDILEENSINRARIDWPALRAETAAYARGARTPAETHAALRYAIYALADRHSYLQPPAAAAELRRTLVSNARTGRASIPPRAELLDGRLGYVAVPSVAGGSPASQAEFATRVQKLIEALDSPQTCGWILDLRRNSGGNLWPMLAGVGPLLGEGEAGASVYPDGRRTPLWYRDGQAGFGDFTQLRVHEPHRLAGAAHVAVLTGPATASSAEVLAVAFRGRVGAASFGAPTAGLSAGNKTFELRDGAALILTVAATSDRAGRVYLGPIEPEHAVGEGTLGGDPVRDAAAAWLAGSPSCSSAG